ncbi:MAG: hypothetical protein A2079_00240 [Geobacteraceae bacterium GWC2_48_7]|nr:MAG: hypothetical protein A2079_00240 [Geobacteraceae bacterium GWC2_48_7]
MIQTFQEILRQKKRLIIPLAVLLLLNVTLLLIAGIYQDPLLTTLGTRLTELRGQVAAAGNRDIATVYRQGKTDLETLLQIVPLKRKFPVVLGEIMEAAHNEGVATGNVTYKPSAVKDENLFSYNITMTVSGNYAELKSFIANLQQIRQLVVVDQIAMSNTNPFAESINMELRLTVYLREGA